VWNVVWLLFFRTTPNRLRIFNWWRSFLLRCFGAKIGKGCTIFNSCEIWYPWNLEIGDMVALSENVICYTVDKIKIGNQTTISRDVFLCCASHDVTSPIMELTYAPIEIGDNSWIAARSIIMPGRSVGDGAVVAAGAVVIKDVEPWIIVGGNPACFIKKRELR
jgi:putative colanic acid biosynthesis acetyltransferase WcaF